MDMERIIAELEAERDRLDRAIATLQEGNSRGGGKVARKIGRRRRHMSAAARKRIGESMKRRWAERKKRKST